MCAHQLQHYVPKFLLRRFACPDNGRVHVFDKHTGVTFVTNPNNVAAERGAYDFQFSGCDVTLEPSLAALESRAAYHIARIVRDRRLHVDDDLERAELSRFFAVQLVRTPAYRAMSRDLRTRMEAWLRQEGMPHSYFSPPAQIGEGENAEKAMAAQAMGIAPKMMAPAILEKDWLLLAADQSQRFLIGDHPLTMHNDVERPFRGNLGLKVAGIELYFPLTPRLALAMVCRSHQDKLIDGIERIDRIAQDTPSRANALKETWASALDIVEAMQGGMPLMSKPENMEFFNSLQISAAERFVFSSAGDFTLVREMLKVNPELRNGHRMQEATGKF